MRLNNISLLRTIAFLFIILYHVLFQLYFDAGGGRDVFPFLFAVQIFLFVSGYLYASKKIENFRAFYVKQLHKVMVPAIICFLMFLGYYFIFWGSGVFEKSFALIASEMTMSLGHYWFLFAILACYALLGIMQVALDKGHKRQKVALTGLFFLFVMEFVCVGFLGLQVCILPYFLGVVLGRKRSVLFNQPDSTPKGRAWAITSAVIFVVVFILYASLDQFVFYDDVNFGFGFSNYLAAVLAISFSVAFMYLFKFLNKRPQGRVLKLCDKYSFYIYFTHHFLIVGSSSLLYLTGEVAVNILVALGLTVCLTVILEALTVFVMKKISVKSMKVDTGTDKK